MVDGFGGVEITVDGKTTDYWLFSLRTDFGVGFHMVKQVFAQVEAGVWELRNGECYAVCLDGAESQCSCQGFLKHGMCKDGKGCKHIAGLTALRQRGLI
jgi:hypothetical protein